MTLTILFALGLAGLSLIAVASKLVESSYGPFGLLVMLANVPYETLVKKIRMQRITADGMALVAISAGWWALAGPAAGLVFALVFSAAWAYALHVDGQAVRSNRIYVSESESLDVVSSKQISIVNYFVYWFIPQVSVFL